MGGWTVPWFPLFVLALGFAGFALAGWVER